jgi:hypothetical protein
MILPIGSLGHVELTTKSTRFGGPGPHWKRSVDETFSRFGSQDGNSPKMGRFHRQDIYIYIYIYIYLYRKAIRKQTVIQPTIWWGVFHRKNLLYFRIWLVHVCIVKIIGIIRNANFGGREDFAVPMGTLFSDKLYWVLTHTKVVRKLFLKPRQSQS